MTPDPHDVENAVLAVLAGTALNQAAVRVPMDPADLGDAIATYRAAGLAALNTPARTHSWYQVRIHFTDWDAAEQTAATHLGPFLQKAREAGTLADWWFLRKHPCWRLRCRPGPSATITEMKAALAVVLDSLVTAGTVQRWWESLYEPESPAFGGNRGMDIAHDLFHADSRGILAHLRHVPVALEQPAVGRRELSVLWCASLLRGARQDSHEQGDIWHRVVQMRPLPEPPPADQLHRMAPGLKRLMSLDTSPTSPLFAPGGPLPQAAPWAAVFATAGRQLADAARDGTLERGLRDVLANHVIFHWNRIGIPAPAQAVLARAARNTLLNLEGSAD
jgi:thiopeptide-type bacteriocin biosynthesis protein